MIYFADYLEYYVHIGIILSDESWNGRDMAETKRFRINNYKSDIENGTRRCF